MKNIDKNVATGYDGPVTMVDFSEFKRGMLGLLKLLMYEAMQSQRLDHYAMYKTMQDITGAWEAPSEVDVEDGITRLIEEDEEAIARMILNFPKDTGTDYA